MLLALDPASGQADFAASVTELAISFTASTVSRSETHAPQQTAFLFDHVRASLFRSSGSASSSPEPPAGAFLLAHQWAI
jgi:hypothetical protein